MAPELRACEELRVQGSPPGTEVSVHRFVGWIGGTCGIALVVVAALGWLAGNSPSPSADGEAASQAARPLDGLPGLRPGADGSPPILAEPALVSLLGGTGLVLLGLCWIRARRRDLGGDRVDPRLARKILRQAAAVARRGDTIAAAELCREADLTEEAVAYFQAAEEYARAAEVRHDQNRFLESAELYCKAGSFESAGTILASQEEFVRAAECYRKAGRYTVAGEMYERAGDPRRAGKCYVEADFHRQAADAYSRAQCWAEAASALERVVAEEFVDAADSNRKQRELQELVKKAAMLHDQAGDLEAAQNILVRGRCYAEAGDVALRLEQYARAAELFVEARDAPRAAEALRQIGEERAAARILGQHHRDHGDDDEAALHLEAAGEYLDAGDLYRKLEDFERAGECYERHGDAAQAAEMFRLVGESVRAAANFERAGRYLEAAECWREHLLGVVGGAPADLEGHGRDFGAGHVAQRLDHRLGVAEFGGEVRADVGGRRDVVLEVAPGPVRGQPLGAPQVARVAAGGAADVPADGAGGKAIRVVVGTLRGEGVRVEALHRAAEVLGGAGVLVQERADGAGGTRVGQEGRAVHCHLPFVYPRPLIRSSVSASISRPAPVSAAFSSAEKVARRLARSCLAVTASWVMRSLFSSGWDTAS